MMRLLDISYNEPGHNLALDEVLLEGVGAGITEETLRFWESPIRFAVVGTAQVLHEEVDDSTCRADSVPVMRRCSAGGCVLQGPGSLNFTLALRLDKRPEARSLHKSYAYILGRIADALRQSGVDVTHRDSCDLAIGPRKVSGNAQRRRKNAILHHGTLLYEPDYEGMEKYLREPAKRPEYRGQRKHRDFVGKLPLGKTELQRAVCDGFASGGDPLPLTSWESRRIRNLADEVYNTKEWIYRR